MNENSPLLYPDEELLRLSGRAKMASDGDTGGGNGGGSGDDERKVFFSLSPSERQKLKKNPKPNEFPP